MKRINYPGAIRVFMFDFNSIRVNVKDSFCR